MRLNRLRDILKTDVVDLLRAARVRLRLRTSLLVIIFIALALAIRQRWENFRHQAQTERYHAWRIRQEQANLSRDAKYYENRLHMPHRTGSPRLEDELSRLRVEINRLDKEAESHDQKRLGLKRRW